MSGTKAGGVKAAETNKLRQGADFYAKIGAKGGKNGHTGGFWADRELARRAGKIGGQRSKRGPSKFTSIQSGEQDRPTPQEEPFSSQTEIENPIYVKEQKPGFFSSVLRAFGE